VEPAGREKANGAARDPSCKSRRTRAKRPELIALTANDPTSEGDEHGTGLADLLAVWLMFLIAALAVFVTYSRVPPAELYNTSVGGVAGGAGRTLVFLNYPVALAAVAIAVICADRRAASGRRTAVPAAAIGIGLCLVVAVPGVVDQGDLDARFELPRSTRSKRKDGASAPTRRGFACRSVPYAPVRSLEWLQPKE
jgi:hypothetical protein